MIYLGASIRWPWFKGYKSIYDDYLYKSWSVSKNKTLELQVSKGGDDLIGFMFSWSMRRDHAGLDIEVSLFRRFILISFHDNRHWNDNTSRYINYDDPEEVKE